MKLKILLPTQVLLEEEVTKVVAEAENGFFGLLPRHIDFVTALVPGLLSFEAAAGGEAFVAIDEGILVKHGSEVLISTRNAIRGPDLGMLKQAIEAQFRVLDEYERAARSALSKLEVDFMRRFIELEEHNHG